MREKTRLRTIDVLNTVFACRREIQFLDMAAGGVIADQGTHILNYGMALNGDSPVVQVFGAASGHTEFEGSHPSPDTTVGYLLFANGVLLYEKSRVKSTGKEIEQDFVQIWTLRDGKIVHCKLSEDTYAILEAFKD